MPSRRVYVDFDDVLCETARGLLLLLEKEFGKRISYEEMRWFDLGRSFGLTKAELERFMASAHRPECIASLAPVAGAGSALARWKEAGREICIVTGRPPSTEAASRAWLADHRMPYDALYFTDKYSRLPPGPGLLALDELSRMDFSLAIDDAPAMLSFLIERMAMPVVIFDRPWNSGFVAGSPRATIDVTRCRSWEEIASRSDL